MQDCWNTVFDSIGSSPPEASLTTPERLQQLQAAVSGGVVAPLTHIGAIRVAGEDAATFLHAQLSNAIEDMAASECRLAAYCSPKGRVLALFRVLRDDAGFLLLTDDSVLDGVLRRLKMFVLRSKVTLDDARTEVGMVGAAGAGSEALIAEAAGSPPRAGGEVAAAGDLLSLRLTDHDSRFVLVAPTMQLADLWTGLAGGLTAVGVEAWRLLDIRAGLPLVTAETQDRFVPQMLNLAVLGGISYGKGCYPGQEVVARMHYLGRLKRRMYRIALEATAPPPAATAVRDGAGNEAGEIVTAAGAPDGGVEALAVLRIEAAEQQNLTVDDVPARLLELPYDFPA